jgi:hypothetical protein
MMQLFYPHYEVGFSSSIPFYGNQKTAEIYSVSYLITVGQVKGAGAVSTPVLPH